MIVAAVRQVADWLVDATTGVNALLPSIPHDPSEVDPPAVTVWDATRFSWVASGNVPRDRTGALPLLLVRGPDEQEISAWLGDENGGVTPLTVLVAYVRRPQLSADTDYVLTHAYQTLRAAVRALQAQYQSADVRTRVGVELGRPTYRLVAAQEKLAGEEHILASLEVTFPAADPWVAGATISS